MTQELEKTWAGRVLSTQELTDYSIFLKSRSEQEKKVRTRLGEFG